MLKRVLLIDHVLHKKTGSSRFFEQELTKWVEVERIYIDPADVGAGMNALRSFDLSRIDLAIIWQNEIFALETLRRGVPTLVVPMYDGCGGLPPGHWLSLSGAWVLQFSLQLHLATRDLLPNQFFIQYFPDPSTFPEVTDWSDLRVFFWQRRAKELDITQVSEAVAGQARSIHLHYAPDNSNEPPPSDVWLKQRNVSVSTWFDRREDFERCLRSHNVLFTPRAREGIGMAMLEGLARGMCVVTSPHPTHNEYVAHGINGLHYNGRGTVALDRAKQLGRMARRGVIAGRQRYEARLPDLREFMQAAAARRPAGVFLSESEVDAIVADYLGNVSAYIARLPNATEKEGPGTWWRAGGVRAWRAVRPYVPAQVRAVGALAVDRILSFSSASPQAAMFQKPNGGPPIELTSVTRGPPVTQTSETASSHFASSKADATVEKHDSPRCFVVDPVCGFDYGHNPQMLIYYRDFFSSQGFSTYSLCARSYPEQRAEANGFIPAFWFYYQGFIPVAQPAINDRDRQRTEALLQELERQDESLLPADETEALAIVDWLGLFRDHALAAGDCVFYPSADFYGVVGLTKALRIAFPNPGDAPQIHLRFIGVMETATRTHANPLGVLKWCLRRFARGYNLQVSAEASVYARYLTAVLGLPVAPTLYPLRAEPLPIPTSRPFIVYAAGAGREDKGFFRILDIARRYFERHPRDDVRFVAQKLKWSEEKSRPFLMSQMIAAPNIELLPTVLTAEEMQAQYRRCSLLIAPYDFETYRFRGSAITQEGVALGRPVAITALTGFHELGELLPSVHNCGVDDDFCDIIHSYYLKEPGEIDAVTESSARAYEEMSYKSMSSIFDAQKAVSTRAQLQHQR